MSNAAWLDPKAAHEYRKEVDPTGSGSGMRRRGAAPVVKGDGSELGDSEAHHAYQKLQEALNNPEMRKQMMSNIKQPDFMKQPKKDKDDTNSVGSNDSEGFLARLLRGCARRKAPTDSAVSTELFGEAERKVREKNAEQESDETPTWLRTDRANSFASAQDKTGDASFREIQARYQGNQYE